MTALTDFHFLRPLALLLMLAVPLFWLAWRHGRTDAGAWRDAVDAHLLPYLVERVDVTRGRTGFVLASLGLMLGCVALAGPAWQREPMPLYRNQTARVLALELAPSMLAQDAKPDRLKRAQFKIDDILDRSRDDQTALIGYAGDAFVAAPLTDDVGTVRNLVDALVPSTMPVAGNDTARAIQTAVRLIEQSGLHRGEIILLADSVGDDAVDAARQAHAKGFDVSILGIGTATGAPIPVPSGGFVKDPRGNIVMSRLDAARLQGVAEAGGGRYSSLTPDSGDLNFLLPSGAAGEATADAGASVRQGEVAENARWRDEGPWFVLLLLPLALVGFRRGWLMALALALLSPLHPARAASLKDLWQRPDQQAAAALAHGNAERAAQVARSPAWRGSAAYRGGNYKAAASDFSDTSDADGTYNKGNALAKLGRYDDAIAAYDDALELAPGMPDALANRKSVEEFLKKSQSKKDSKSKQDQKDSTQNSGKQSSGQGSQSHSSGKQQGKNANQDNEQSGNQKDQQSGKQEGEQKNPAQKPSAQSGDKNADQSQQHQQGSDSNHDSSGNDAAAQRQEPDAAQQKALSKAIDKALAKETPNTDKAGKAHAAAAGEDAATRERNQAIDQLLQSVPDDPGGLLRRKFQLEYQQRQQRGGEGG